MFYPTLASLFSKSIFVEGQKLMVVDKFTYFGSTINRESTLDDGIPACGKKAIGAFAILNY